MACAKYNRMVNILNVCDVHTSRRVFCATALLSATFPAFALEPSSDVVFTSDFDELWRTLDKRYCFFAEKQTNWSQVRDHYRPQAVAAKSFAAFEDIIRRTLGELYDAHTHLSNPPEGAPRWPPFDILVERAGQDIRVVTVQAGSAAADSGLSIGDRIIAIDGSVIAKSAALHMPSCLSHPDPVAEAYALNVAVAGHRGQARLIQAARGSGPVENFSLPLKRRSDSPDITSNLLKDGSGYIRIASFANDAVVAAFDKALMALKDTPGLIIDVRSNGGGDTAVARPIMGRFISTPKPYAKMRRRSGGNLSPAWVEYVKPRGPFTYTKPVVVLADHWSGSMAEGFPMGMRGIGRAQIVGTPMMGLGAAVFSIKLKKTALQAQYSAEPVYDVDDKPRWLMQPDVFVPSGKDVLEAGVSELTRLIRTAP